MVESLETEILIIAFIIICIAIILFDIVQVFRIRSRDRKVYKLSLDLNNISLFLENPSKLKEEANILAFERCMDTESVSDLDSFLDHTSLSTDVFSKLICDKSFEDSIVKSYMVYLSTKYKLFFKTCDDSLKNELLYMITDHDIYIRENALRCVYSIGDAHFTLTTLKTLDNSDIQHNDKLIHDGLLSYSGNMIELSDLLITRFEDFSLDMQLVLFSFFRFSTSKYVKFALDILNDESKNRELRLSALRYLSKYHYDPAYSSIVDYANKTGDFWEYRAIAASCLANYPCEESIEVLKKLTSDSEWYVRRNAAESLSKIGCDEGKLNDILSGDDRFAKEQAQYVMDKKELSSSGGKV